MKVVILLCALKIFAVHCYNNWDDEPQDEDLIMCLKDNFSQCTVMRYPRKCTNLDSVIVDGRFYVENRLESLIIDPTYAGSRCVVLFSKYQCQGSYLILDGDKHPSAVLHDFNYSNRAVSVVECSDKLLDGLNKTRTNSSNNMSDLNPSNSVVVNKNHMKDSSIPSNSVEVNENERLDNYKRLAPGKSLKSMLDWGSLFKHSDETRNSKTPLTLTVKSDVDRKKPIEVLY